jgi:putative flavoprotein involved in K+ transport
MTQSVDVVVIGGGQAGLAASHELTGAGIHHVVLERERIAETWRNRWDSFRLVLPNWTLQLPGHPYDGDDPHGYMPRDELVTYLERYASSFRAPIREGVEVVGLQPSLSGWTLETSDGALQTRAVLVATGAFQRAFHPPGWESLPPSVLQIDIAGYRNPEALPPGKVLVVGSGQSGCQIAEELSNAGREVYLACGRAAWLPRRVGDRDIYWWASESGFMDTPFTALTDPRERLAANPQLSGQEGGHDLHFRTLHDLGVTLVGRFSGADDRRAHFAPDLRSSIAFGDQAYQQFARLIHDLAEERGIPVDELALPPLWDRESPDQVELSGFGAVVVASGFRPDYRWMDLPETLDPLGFPIQDSDGNGVIPGLHFLGVHFLRTRKSALLPGVGEDASVIVRTIADRLAR